MQTNAFVGNKTQFYHVQSLGSINFHAKSTWEVGDRTQSHARASKWKLLLLYTHKLELTDFSVQNLLHHLATFLPSSILHQQVIVYPLLNLISIHFLTEMLSKLLWQLSLKGGQTITNFQVKQCEVSWHFKKSDQVSYSFLLLAFGDFSLTTLSFHCWKRKDCKSWWNQVEFFLSLLYTFWWGNGSVHWIGDYLDSWLLFLSAQDAWQKILSYCYFWSRLLPLPATAAACECSSV